MKTNKSKFPSRKKPLDIFIVEDNKVFSLALKGDIEVAFESTKLNVTSFETGELCMQQFMKVNPEIVILDYHLNSQVSKAADGIRMLDWIKKKNFDTNVIMLTSDDNVDIAVKSFLHGASDYVVKTETAMKKINYSLLNIVKKMEALSLAKLYKRMFIGFFICLSIVVGVVLVMQIFKPGLLE